LETVFMKKALIVTLAACAILAPGLSAQQQPPAQPQSPAAAQGVILQRVIVRVNGEIYTQADLEFEQIQALRAMNKSVAPAELLTNPGLRSALQEVTPAILLKAVDDLLLVQHARELGLKFTEEMFTRALVDLKKDNNIPDEATFQAVLKQEGMTMADLRITIERASLISGAQEKELRRNMNLTDEEMRQYYKAHPEDFRKPATVTLREIFVAVATETVNGVPSVNVASDEAAKKKIQTARERALKGEDYAKLVAEFSESATKSSGGVIGPVNVSDLSETIGKLIETMNQGDISEPLRTRAGYQLIKLETKGTADLESFDKAREQIQVKILESRYDVERAKLVERLYSQAVIEWKDESFRKMFEAAKAARSKQK
jgi:peptidyl-prolyl cis-trans isomerase SurA